MVRIWGLTKFTNYHKLRASKFLWNWFFRKAIDEDEDSLTSGLTVDSMDSDGRTTAPEALIVMKCFLSFILNDLPIDLLEPNGRYCLAGNRSQGALFFLDIELPPPDDPLDIVLGDANIEGKVLDVSMVDETVLCLGGGIESDDRKMHIGDQASENKQNQGRIVQIPPSTPLFKLISNIHTTLQLSSTSPFVAVHTPSLW